MDNHVRVSARSSNLSDPLDESLKESFGDNSGAKLTPDGIGEGGAYVELEGLDLGFWGGEGIIELIIRKKLEELIFSDQPLSTETATKTKKPD